MIRWNSASNATFSSRYTKNATEIQPENASTHHFLGVLYEMTEQREGAKKQYELALQYDDRMSETKNNLAYLIAESGGDLDRALKLAQEAKEMMPENPSIADTLGWVMYKRDIQAAAISLFREAIEGYAPGPNRAMTRYHLALSYEKNGEPGRAIDELRVALEESDSFPGRDDAEAALKRLETS